MTRPSITRLEIEHGLRETGLKQGDVVLLHGSVWSLGTVEGEPRAVIDAFLAVLGDTGTLAVPAFEELGVLSRLVRDDPRAVQSVQLPGRIAAVGPHAEALCRNHQLAETAHGQDTPAAHSSPPRLLIGLSTRNRACWEPTFPGLTIPHSHSFRGKHFGIISRICWPP